MSDTLAAIRTLVAAEDVEFSVHAVRRLLAQGIIVTGLLDKPEEWVLVEDYPDYFKGPCVLILSYEDEPQPVHMLWGLATGTVRPAVLVTAYRPDPELWTDDFLERRRVR